MYGKIGEWVDAYAWLPLTIGTIKGKSYKVWLQKYQWRYIPAKRKCGVRHECRVNNEPEGLIRQWVEWDMNPL